MPETPRTDNKDITDSSAEFEFEAVPAVAPITVDYGRRIRLLMAAILVAIIAYTGAWFWFGSELVKGTQIAINDAALKGQTVICDEPNSMGYPFRMGLSCAKTAFSDPGQNFKIEAGAFRSAAQVYQLGHVIGELDGPLKLTAGKFNPFIVNWALAHASIIGAGGLPERLSLEIEKPVITQTNQPASILGDANLAAFHMRHGDRNQIDLALSFEATKVRDAPLFDLSTDAFISGATRFDAAIEHKRPLLEVLRGNDGELRKANMVFADGGSLTISGPLSLSTAGLLSGKLSLKIEKADDFITNIAKLSTALGVEIMQTSALKALAVTDKINITITLKDGSASIGFIPLGQIPAL